MTAVTFILSAVITGLNIFTLIYRFVEKDAKKMLTDVQFQSFIFCLIYWVYITIMEIKELICRSPNIDSFYLFIKNSVFKFIYSLQGFSAFYYVYLKLFTKMKFEDKFLMEFTLICYTLLLFILMSISLCIFYYKLATLSYLKDLLILLIFVLVLWLICSISQAVDKDDWGFLVENLGLFLLVFAMAFNAFQFYNYMVARKTGDVEPTPYTAI